MTDSPNPIDVMYDLSDAELVERWREALPEAKRANAVLRACEGEMVRRMGDRLALETEAGTVVRSPQLGDYQWDKEALRKLFGNRLTEAMYNQIFVPFTEIRTRTIQVKKYAQQLGVTEEELKA